MPLIAYLKTSEGFLSNLLVIVKRIKKIKIGAICPYNKLVALVIRCSEHSNQPAY